MKKIILITSLFKSKRDDYNAVLEKCLKTNAENANINHVVVFFEGEEKDMSPFPTLKHEKVKTVYTKEKTTYQDLIKYANKHHSNDYIVLCHKSIYFDGNTNIERVTKLKKNQLWALHHYQYNDDLEAWELFGYGKKTNYVALCFLAPFENISRFKTKILMQQPGSASYFAQKCIDYGWRLTSPCYSIMPKYEPCEEDQPKDIVNYYKRKDYGKGYNYYSLYGLPACFIEDNVYWKKKFYFYIKWLKLYIDIKLLQGKVHISIFSIVFFIVKAPIKIIIKLFK